MLISAVQRCGSDRECDPDLAEQRRRILGKSDSRARAFLSGRQPSDVGGKREENISWAR